MSKPKRGYWYMFYETFCVLCMTTEVEKERIYNVPKPKEWHKRHVQYEAACSSHFM